jgi:hypothetical protein
VDYETRSRVIIKQRNELESLFIQEEKIMRQQSTFSQREWVHKCWEKAMQVQNNPKIETNRMRK